MVKAVGPAGECSRHWPAVVGWRREQGRLRCVVGAAVAGVMTIRSIRRGGVIGIGRLSGVENPGSTSRRPKAGLPGT